MDWKISTFDSSGQHIADYRQSTHSMTSMQVQSSCNSELAKQRGVRPTASVKVEVRPHQAKPEDRRRKRAELSCDEVRADKNALSNHIKPPQPPKPKVRDDVINLWD